MSEQCWLAECFEEHRSHLRAVAYRMLGSGSEADDAVQETWLRISTADTDEVANMGGWLTTVVARVCLNTLRSRATRREEPRGMLVPQQTGSADNTVDPEHQALLADSIGPALLVVLDALTPAERLAFVLHDMFAVPFDDIAPIVGRSPSATRQLASRARRRVQGAGPATDVDLARTREVVDAFLSASRHGDFEALLAVLDPDVVVRADPAAVRMGAEAEVRGAATVARSFAGRARAARAALVNGVPGAVWAAGGRARVAFSFLVADGRITQIDLLADPERLRELGLHIET